jgi:hypothetical protein
LPPEPGFARREAKPALAKKATKKKGRTGETRFPP